MLLTIFMVKVSQTGCSAVAVTVGTTVLCVGTEIDGKTDFVCCQQLSETDGSKM